MNSGVRTDKCFLLCATGETMFFFPQLLSFHPTALTLSSDKSWKDSEKCHNQRILVFRLRTGVADSSAALCDYSEMHFHISLLPVLPVGLAPSSPAPSLSVSVPPSVSVPSLFSFHQFAPLPASDLFSHALPPHARIILYYGAPGDSFNSSRRAIRPISPISWC